MPARAVRSSIQCLLGDQTLLNGAISGTKVLSSVPNLITTFPTPASTTSPTPNFLCLTLSPTLNAAPPETALSGSLRPGKATPHPPRPETLEKEGTVPDLYSSGISERKRDGILYSRSPQLERSLACVSVSVSLARVMPT